MIKNIIFDFDGVLVDSEILARKAFSRYLFQKNIKLTENEFSKNYSGKKLTEVISIISERFNIKKQNIFFDEVMKLSQEIYRDDLKAVKGVKKFLEVINQRKLIGSNRGKKSIIEGLKKVKLLEFFDEKNIFSYDMVSNPKPSPEVYLKAVEVTNINKNNTVIIEDSFIGVKAGVSADIKVIGITAGSHWRNRSSDILIKAGSIFVAKNFNEVLNMIKEL